MYFRPRIIPCLSIINQDLVKTTNFKSPRYLGDPINAVKIFNEKGVDELCVMDISASKKGRGPQLEYLKDIASEAFMPLSYGGGISTMEEIKNIFFIGYEKVILNTAFFKTPALVTEAANHAGAQSVVVSIDVKTDLLGKKVCYTRDGREKVNMTPVEAARFAEQLGAGEILLNSITNDGAMQGYDLKLISSITKSISIPVIACGGAGGIRDIKQVLTYGGAHAAAAGSMFVYYGSEKAVLINVPEESDFVNGGIYHKDDMREGLWNLSDC